METKQGFPQNRPAAGLQLSATIDDALASRGPGNWPVSLALTVLSVRKRIPGCDVSDRDLADMAAIRAVEKGCNVIFDADLLTP